jgi:hypothetical protein
MGRKIIDTYPVVKVALGPSRYSMRDTWDRARSQQAANEFEELVKRHVTPHFDGQADFDLEMVEEVRCEHCNSTWTEDGADYNGGCCGLDEANSPDRLSALQKLIDQVEAGDFYRWDADRRRTT